MNIYPNIYEQQKKNKRKTVFIMFIFVLFFVFLGYGLDFFYFGNDPIGLLGQANGLPISTILSFTIAFIFVLNGYFNGPKYVLSLSGAYPILENSKEHLQLKNVVEEMKIASGLPMPKVYIISDPDPNAFATGINPENSYIAVTEGLLNTLNRDELQAVVAHEMGHIRNYDTRLMTIVAALIGAIALLSDFAVRGLRFGMAGRSNRRSRSTSATGPIQLLLFIIWIIGIILAPIIGRLLAMAISRQREYYADATAAELTRNPIALARALEKLERATAPTKSIKRGSAHMCIVDPLGIKANDSESLLADLFATHPPIKKRIQILKTIAYQYEKESKTTTTSR